MTKIELLKHKLIAKNQFNSDKEQELTKKRTTIKRMGGISNKKRKHS